MRNKSILWIPIIYLLFITGINIYFLYWANSESYKYNITIIEEQENISNENVSNNQTELPNDMLDTLRLADPIIDSGKRAEKALPVFVYGVIAGMFVSIFTFLPSWIKKYIDKIINDFDYKDMDWNLIIKYEYGIFFANAVITFFQVLGVIGFFDYGSAIVNEVK